MSHILVTLFSLSFLTLPLLHGQEKDAPATAEPKATRPMPKIAVDHLQTRVIDAPPMVTSKDIESLIALSNHSDKPFEFTFLRAVYSGNGEAQSTVIYFNNHSGTEKERMTKLGFEADATEKKKPSSPKPSKSTTAKSTEQKHLPTEADDPEPAPPEEQYTIAGAPFPGDFRDQKTIKKFQPSHNFTVGPKEQIVLGTESAGTHLGNTLRYKSHSLTLEFLDEKATVMGRVTLAIKLPPPPGS